jgi:hypothetical protein
MTRRLSKYVGRASLAIAASLMSGARAFGCVVSPDDPPPICQRFWEEDAVALVNVQKVEVHNHERFVTLQTIEVFRGYPPDKLMMKDVVTDCGPRFGRTGQYLAWFYQSKGEWKAFGEPIGASSEDLKYAHSMKNPPGFGHVYGTLDKPKRSRLLAVREQEDLPDRHGVAVVVDNGSESFKAAVQRNLSFNFPALPLGKYKISVEGLPSNLTVDTEDIEIHGGGCQELVLFSASNASIVGRVVAEGRMPRFAQVFLISAKNIGKVGPRSSRWVLTDGKTGKFEFKHVEPGEYVLGFEVGHSPTLDVPYASQYYSSAPDVKDAEIIDLHASEHIRNLEFKVGNEVARRRVRVRVTWGDGTPAPNATAYLRDAHNPYSSVAEKQTPTDVNGEALLEGFVDTDYDVDANAVCKGHSGSNKIENKTISASPKDAFVSLTVKGRKCPLVDWQSAEKDE